MHQNASSKYLHNRNISMLFRRTERKISSWSRVNIAHRLGVCNGEVMMNCIWASSIDIYLYCKCAMVPLTEMTLFAAANAASLQSLYYSDQNLFLLLSQLCLYASSSI